MSVNRSPLHESSARDAAFQLWQDHGYELREIEGPRFYLTKTYPEQIFVVRHAMDTRLLPDPKHHFRITSKDLSTGILGRQERWASGVGDVSSVIRAWRRTSLGNKHQ